MSTSPGEVTLFAVVPSSLILLQLLLYARPSRKFVEACCDTIIREVTHVVKATTTVSPFSHLCRTEQPHKFVSANSSNTKFLQNVFESCKVSCRTKAPLLPFFQKPLPKGALVKRPNAVLNSTFRCVSNLFSTYL